MRLGLNQSQRLEQRLVQSPQMIQAMQILQLPAMDLVARIQQELEENPFLEIVEPERPTETPEGEQAQPEQEPDRVEQMLDDLEKLEREYGDGRRTRSSSGEEGDKKLEAMQNTPDTARSLPEILMEELAFLELDDRKRALAEYLLWSLDDHGRLNEPLEEIAASIQGLILRRAAPHAIQSDSHDDDDDGSMLFDLDGVGASLGEEPVTVEELEGVLAELRAVVHPALGARDLRECLLLQIDAMGIEDQLLRTLVERHLEDVEHNRLPRIAKETGRDLEEVKDAIEMLRSLEPAPGASRSEARAAVITPEVMVEEVDGRWEIRLDRQRTPRLMLSPAYRELLKKSRDGDGVRDWVKKRLESARWFLEAVEQRQSTLERISEAIFKRQRDFLEKGVRALRPLRMQEIADEVGVHISTVSRAVSGKYAQTPRGIYPLKFFFSGGTAKAGGGMASQQSVKQRLADLVGQEDPSNPLSDDQIAEELEKRDGIRIARRTVTKYRKALSIPASSQRKRF